MACSSGFRPPQFSESQAWLPVWLQQCDIEQLNIECIGKDYVTFEERVEELKFLQKDKSNGESMRGEDGCNIGQLFVSGTDSTPFSFAQSAENVAQFHLCLSSDSNLDNTMVTADANLTDSSLVIRALQSSPDLYQKDANLSFGKSGTVNWPPTVELEKTHKENEVLRHERSVNFFADAVELCVAASEALVIKEAIENDSFAKPSASAILEASLQVKQARLALSTNISSVRTDEDSEVDNLSDLDDLAMVSAYEDAGIYFNEFLGNKLSVSRVNDTFDSEHDENLNHETTSAPAMACGKSCDYGDTQMKLRVLENEMKSRKNVGEECFDAGMRKKVNGNLRDCSDIDVGHHYDYVMTVDDQHIPVTAMTIPKNKLHKTNVSSSSIMHHQAGEKSNTVNFIDQERFQSRWLGGWTRKSEEQNNIVINRIPKPFAGETSFFSESADAAPDEDSVVQNIVKGTTVASQLSIPSENLFNTTKGSMLLSQDAVRSSSTSLEDPLCSVVPCSISKDAYSSPAMNYEDTICHGLLSDTFEHEEDRVPETTSFNSAAAEGDRIVMPVDKFKESGGIYRSFNSLRNYSKLGPRHTEIFKRKGHCKKSFSRTPFADCEEPAKDMSEVHDLQEVNPPIQPHVVKDRAQCHFDYFDCYMRNLREGNASQTVLPKNKVKFLTSQDPQHLLLHGKNSKSSLAPKHVHFSEKETSIPDKRKLHKVQTLSKTGCSTRAAKRSTRTSARLESKAQQMDRFLKDSSIEKKRLIFQNMEFLLTGLSQRKEKEIEGLIRKYGGIVLPHIPPKKGKRSSWFKVPIVLCLKKTQSLKFLFGCAVNAFVLKVNWLIDSIAAGSILPPKRYTIVRRSTSKKDDRVYPAHYNTRSLIFNNLGVILHGKTKYFSNIATVIEHGGGQVFRTLQRLIQNLEAGRVSMGIVVTDEENCASRHLKQCALEQNIPITSIYWIIKSLYAGKIVPLEEEKRSHRQPPSTKLQMGQDPIDLSQEI